MPDRLRLLLAAIIPASAIAETTAEVAEPLDKLPRADRAI